jgi:hypothetical protein
MVDLNNFITTPMQSERDQQLCEITVRDMAQLASRRSLLNNQCEEIAGLIDPASRGTFLFGSEPVPYSKKTDQQVDSTGMIALSRFAAICDSLLTPKNMTWHTLSADNDYVMKDRDTKMWFYNTTRKLFRYRYAATSGFVSANQQVFKSLGAYGNGVAWVDSFYDPIGRTKGLRYAQIPFGDIYIERDFQGVPIGFYRILRLTAQQAYGFPAWRTKLPEIIKNALISGSQQQFTFIHRVCRRDDYDPIRLDYKGKPYASYYICRDSKTLMSEGGYNSLPISASRYTQAPSEQDGRSVAMEVLPALKTLNAQKKVFLKQGHRAADPVLLMADDGLINMNMTPGANNKGGVTADGKPLVHILPTGDIQISEKMMAVEIDVINDAFLVKLFSIAEKTNITATQAIEIINEKGILIAPTLGRQESEYLGPNTVREMDVMADIGALDPMPPRLREARGEYKVVFTSPLAQSVRAGEAAGFFRSVEGVKELVNITGDQSLLDPFQFDRAIPDIATNIQGTPEPWMATEQEIAGKRQARAQAAKTEQAIKAAPAAAAMIKAQAGLNPAQRDISSPAPAQGL